MRTYDLAPLYRSTVGFDRLFSLLDQGLEGAAPGYPPYNIERTGDNAYRVSVAVAGFDDLLQSGGFRVDLNRAPEVARDAAMDAHVAHRLAADQAADLHSAGERIRVWTDDYSSVLPLLRGKSTP